MRADCCNYTELGEIFGLCADRVRRVMPKWKLGGFPAPLPWSNHTRLWNRAAVLAWKERQERAQGCLPPPKFTLLDGGRAAR